MVAIFSYGFQVADDNFTQAGVSLNTLSDYENLLAQAEKSNYITAQETEALTLWRENPAEWK